MSIKEIQDEIVEELSVFDDWMDKYQYLIDLGNDISPLSDEFKTEDNLIDGCQSKVWLHAGIQDGKINFKADSDAVITKGIISLLLKVYNNRTPAEILENDVYFIEEIGLRENLSPTRANGLLAMIKKIKLYAMAYQAKQ